MTETISEWTKDHPKAIGRWVCADGVKRWVCGPNERGEPMGYAPDEVVSLLWGREAPIRPYVETKKIEVEAWGGTFANGMLRGVFMRRDDALRQSMGPVVRLTGTVEIEA